MTVSAKKLVVDDIDKRLGTMSLQGLCREHQIQAKQYKDWKKTFESSPKGQDPRWNAVTVHKGRPSSLSHLEDDIMSWFCERENYGLPTTVNMCVVFLCSLDDNFRRKTKKAQIHSVRRILKKNAVVYRAVTHTSQKKPEETRATALEFIATCIPRMSGIF